eukprot:5592672-Prymnesium_polylepis.1
MAVVQQRLARIRLASIKVDDSAMLLPPQYEEAEDDGGDEDDLLQSNDPETAWMQFGLELADLELTAEEEAELDNKSRASLQASRVANQSGSKRVSAAASWM